MVLCMQSLQIKGIDVGRRKRHSQGDRLDLKKSRIYSPDVRLKQVSSGHVVEKTYKDKILPIRIIGVVLVWWEAFIYGKLEGITGIPTLLDRPDPYTIVTRFMAGENLRETTRKPDSLYFDRLAEIINNIHSRGVVHLDLRNRRNYGIDPQGMPYVLDFGASLYIPWPRFLRKMLGKLDWMGFLKIKAKLAPGLISNDEKRALLKGSLLSYLWLVDSIPRTIRRFIRSLRLRFFHP